MSADEAMQSWFTKTLDSVKATLVEHRTALEQLLAAMRQDSYADELQLHALMEVRLVLNEACAALGDAFSRLSAAHALSNSAPHLVPAVGGISRAAPHIAHAVHKVKSAQESLKVVNARVRATAVLFTSEATRAGLVNGEVTTARDLIAAAFVPWDCAMDFIANARGEFN